MKFYSANIDKTLDKRGDRYGEFKDVALFAQEMKSIMRIYGNFDKLNDVQTEALHMIASKLGRILNGDPDYCDSWHDVAGYATLAVNDIKRRRNMSD